MSCQTCLNESCMSRLNKEEGERTWQVYIIRCSDNSLYTGITTNMQRRYRQHLQGIGARFFRGRQPRRVVYLETGHDRSSAARREYEIKQMTRIRKYDLIASAGNEIPAAHGNPHHPCPERQACPLTENTRPAGHKSKGSAI